MKLGNDIIEAFWGYDLFYVGGWVRDRVIENIENREIFSKDVDFATNATPTAMITLCKSIGLNFRYTNNSIAHGTITIEGFEFTTFRKDVSTDGRNATVEFAETIEEDLSRRDFTINAMAINVFSNELIDPFNGITDIRNKIIRAVGNPDDRLKEDTLRSLRAIRFANRLGYEIEYNLGMSIILTPIDNLSVERVRDEFMKILETRKSNYINSILHKVIPEFKVLIGLDGGYRHSETVDEHSIYIMESIMKVSDKPLLSFIGLLHDIGKGHTSDADKMFENHEDIGADKIKEIMERMKFSNIEIEYAYMIVKNHMRWHFYIGGYSGITNKAIRRAIRDLPDKFDKEGMITDLCIITWSDSQANLLNKKESLEDYTERRGIYSRALEIVRNKPIIKVSGLEINGNDLIEMGFKPSPTFNIILKDVEEKIFNEEIENTKEVLKNYVKDRYI
jgi:tRNA nucleotidyltransferase (CCA-adding enzyme)